MKRTDVSERATAELLGFAHVAIAVGDEAASMRWRPASRPTGRSTIGPRRTGDGYYECVVRDPEGNRVEIAAELR